MRGRAAYPEKLLTVIGNFRATPHPALRATFSHKGRRAPLSEPDTKVTNWTG